MNFTNIDRVEGKVYQDHNDLVYFHLRESWRFYHYIVHNLHNHIHDQIIPIQRVIHLGIKK